MSLAKKTVTGVAPPAPVSAPSPTSRGVPSGRYRHTPVPDATDALDVVAATMSIADAAGRIFSATEQAATALDLGDAVGVRKCLRDVETLAATLKKFELAILREAATGGRR